MLNYFTLYFKIHLELLSKGLQSATFVESVAVSKHNELHQQRDSKQYINTKLSFAKAVVIHWMVKADSTLY